MVTYVCVYNQSINQTLLHRNTPHSLAPSLAHSQLRLLLHLPNLQLRPVLLQHALIMILYSGQPPSHNLQPSPQPRERTLPPSLPAREFFTYLPKLLTRVLATHALEYLSAARVLVDEGVELVHAVIHNDVEAFLDRGVLGDLLCCELLRHGVCFACVRACCVRRRRVRWLGCCVGTRLVRTREGRWETGCGDGVFGTVEEAREATYGMG